MQHVSEDCSASEVESSTVKPAERRQRMMDWEEAMIATRNCAGRDWIHLWYCAFGLLMGGFWSTLGKWLCPQDTGCESRSIDLVTCLAVAGGGMTVACSACKAQDRLQWVLSTFHAADACHLR